jgi:hypothetical protein
MARKMFNMCNSVLIYNCNKVDNFAKLSIIRTEEDQMNTLYYRVSVKFIIKVLRLFMVKKTLPVNSTDGYTNFTTSSLRTN